jgi:hypothetical protein
MRFTRAQAALGMVRAVSCFAIAVASTIFIEGALATFSQEQQWPNGWAILTWLLGALLLTAMGGLLAWVGAAITAMLVGVGLTAIAWIAMKRVTHWQVGLVAFVGIGLLAGTAVVLAWYLPTSLAWSETFAGWLGDLDLALVIVFAGASTGVGWYLTWKQSLTRVS